MWDDEDDEETKKLTPKQRLLGWIQNKVPQLPINNFNRDWQDGKALGALVDNCAPGKDVQPDLGPKGPTEELLSQHGCSQCSESLYVAVLFGCYGSHRKQYSSVSFGHRVEMRATYLERILQCDHSNSRPRLGCQPV